MTFKNLTVASAFGFRVVETDAGPIAVALSEKECRDAEGKRLGISPAEVTGLGYCMMQYSDGFSCIPHPFTDPPCEHTCVMRSSNGLKYCVCEENS